MPPQQYQSYGSPPDMPSQNPAYLQPQSAKRSHPWGLILLLILFVALTVIGFSVAAWAWGQSQNYKNNSDKITAKAVSIAIQQEDTKKDNAFAQQEKSPLKTYQGPDTYGSIMIAYPKTWSAYVVSTNQSIPVDGYFQPDYVPGVDDQAIYALRLQVVARSYDQELKQFDGKVKAGAVTLSAYTAKNVAGVVGSRIDGAINQGQNDSMVLLPLRDKTIEISTQSQEFLDDFNNIVLANLKFSP